MRKDMAKVIVERERRGGRGPARRPPWEKNADPDDLPTKEGMRRRHAFGGDRKQLNENLSPLKRYLRAQVGRPWNVVYRDISAHISPASAVQQHVRVHLWDFVHRHVTICRDGEVITRARFGWPRRLFCGDLYVHPRTGILSAVKPWRRHR